jgi:hypothetical protein
LKTSRVYIYIYIYIYKLCTERSFRRLRRQRQSAEKPAFDDDDGNEVVVVAALKFFEFFVFFSLSATFSLRSVFVCFFIIWRLFSVALFTDNANKKKKKKKKKKKLSWNNTNTNTNNTNSQPHHVLQTGQTIAQTREGRKRNVLVFIGTKQNSQA